MERRERCLLLLQLLFMAGLIDRVVCQDPNSTPAAGLLCISESGTCPVIRSAPPSPQSHSPPRHQPPAPSRSSRSPFPPPPPQSENPDEASPPPPNVPSQNITSAPTPPVSLLLLCLGASCLSVSAFVFLSLFGFHFV
ncbi:hypothetical protein Ancab_023052 [Ancistrocladus abbreviatus]